MKLIQIEFTVIIAIYLTAITISEDFEIFRTRPAGEDGWIDGTDSFKIPPSLCDQGGLGNCAQFSAHVNSPNNDQCFCGCPTDEATFLMNNNGGRCLGNALVRGLLGE